MALSAAQRRRIPSKDFVFPKTRKYPIDTRKRAQEALSLAALHGSQLGGTKGRALIDKVYGKVIRRYPALSESDSKTMRAYLRRKGKKTMARSNPVTMSDKQVLTHILKHLKKYQGYLLKIDVPKAAAKDSFNLLDDIADQAHRLMYQANDLLNLTDYDPFSRANPGRKKTRKNATYGTYRRGTLGYDKGGPDRTSRREAGEPGRKRKMPPAVKSRAALVKKAFALREKTGSRMKPTTIMKDPAAAIRRLSK